MWSHPQRCDVFFLIILCTIINQQVTWFGTNANFQRSESSKGIAKMSWLWYPSEILPNPDSNRRVWQGNLQDLFGSLFNIMLSILILHADKALLMYNKGFQKILLSHHLRRKTTHTCYISTTSVHSFSVPKTGKTTSDLHLFDPTSCCFRWFKNMVHQPCRQAGKPQQRYLLDSRHMPGPAHTFVSHSWQLNVGTPSRFFRMVRGSWW